MFVSAKMIISGKSGLLYSAGLFFCALTLLLFWVFGMKGGSSPVLTQKRDGTVLSSIVPFACLFTSPLLCVCGQLEMVYVFSMDCVSVVACSL